MKLRLRPGSLRLRLRQGDVRDLLQGGFCSRDVVLGPDASQRFIYRLQLGEQTQAHLSSSQILVTLESSQAKRWADSEQIGIEVTQETGGPALQILIEKDFACIDGNGVEPQDDAFPNPLANCGPNRE